MAGELGALLIDRLADGPAVAAAALALPNLVQKLPPTERRPALYAQVTVM